MIRELKEELGIVVSEACLAPLTFASHSYPDFHLLMPLYVCRRWEGTVTATEGQTARLGEAEPAAGLPDAAGGRAAGVSPDGTAVMQPITANGSVHDTASDRSSPALSAARRRTAIEYALIAAGIAHHRGSAIGTWATRCIERLKRIS